MTSTGRLFIDLHPTMAAHGTVRVPGSKSISIRVLLLAALADGETTIAGLLRSDDTTVMIDALQALGVAIRDAGDTLVVNGTGAFPNRAAEVFVGNSGLSIRTLTAVLAFAGGTFRLSGVPRMHERPIGDLVDALTSVGARISYDGKAGFPPLTISPMEAATGSGPRLLRVDASASSQFLTGLLQAAPMLASDADVVVGVDGDLISRPYVDLTIASMRRFGVVVREQPVNRFTVDRGARFVAPGRIVVEGDASSASYLLAAGLLGGGPVRVEGVGRASVQGDARFVDVLIAMGAQVTQTDDATEVRSPGIACGFRLRAIDADFNDIPDAAMTVAVLALFANGPTMLRNIGSWRVKETDRLAAMATELRKLGAGVEEGADFLRITPPASPSHWKAASIHTYDDHRMAMCFALAAFNPAGLPVRIEDPQCVSKTFPDYFEALFSLAHTFPASIPVICVDGPSASGKGTLAAALAQRLGYRYMDSGALYRVTALAAVRAGLALDAAHEVAIAALAQRLPVRFAGDKVWLDGADATDAIRTEQAGMHASTVSAMPAVRTALVALQHSFRTLPGLVADGRDMGTVIFPDAPLKVYLTATAGHRAERRYKQLISKGF
ncbi:MAG: 3-phosphoshikimate 1-carboxyvinyltransferase, partial [Burkholderiaceae bacterium]